MGGAKFRRQYVWDPYVLDFFCTEKRLAVEADGGQHFDAEGLAYDQRRTRVLEGQGIRVLRFTNLEILQQTDSVLQAILMALETPSP